MIQVGRPSPRELDCLRRAAEWEELMTFVAVLDKGIVVECRFYGTWLTPWQCLNNQLSDYCLPGWPCYTCEEAVGLQIPPIGCKVIPRKRPKTSSYNPKTMSRAVARDLGLI